MENVNERVRDAVQARDWQEVGELLQRGGVSDELCRLALEEACKEADDHVLTEFILPQTLHCQHGPNLNALVTRGLWNVLHTVLQQGKISAAQQQFVVEKASRFADDKNFLVYILPHCAEDHLLWVFRTLVSRGLWKSVSGFLQKGVSEELLALAVKEASRRASEDDFIECILPHCTGSLLSIVHQTLSNRKLTRSSQIVMKAITTENKEVFSGETPVRVDTRGESIDLAVCRCDLRDETSPPTEKKETFPSDESGTVDTKHESHEFPLSRCNLQDDIRPSAKVDASSEGNKQEASSVNQSTMCMGGSSNTKTEQQKLRCAAQVKESIQKQTSNFNDSLQKGNMLDMLISAVGDIAALNSCQEKEKKLEASTGKVAHSSTTPEANNSKTAVTANTGHTVTTATFQGSSCQQNVHILLADAVKRRHWQKIKDILHQDEAGDELSIYALMTICNEDYKLSQYIFPLCTSHQRDALLRYLMEYDMWHVLNYVLEQGIIGQKEVEFVLEESSQLADDFNFCLYIHPHWTYNQPQSVFEIIVSRGLWQSVGSFLQTGVSEELAKWSVEEASQRATEEVFVQYILPHITGPLLSIALDGLSQRQLMEGMAAVLQKINDDSGKKRYKGTQRRNEAISRASGPDRPNWLGSPSTVSGPDNPGGQRSFHTSRKSSPVDDAEDQTRKEKAGTVNSKLARAFSHSDWLKIEQLLWEDQNRLCKEPDKQLIDEEVWYENANESRQNRTAAINSTLAQAIAHQHWDTIETLFLCSSTERQLIDEEVWYENTNVYVQECWRKGHGGCSIGDDTKTQTRVKSCSSPMREFENGREVASQSADMVRPQHDPLDDSHQVLLESEDTCATQSTSQSSDAKFENIKNFYLRLVDQVVEECRNDDGIMTAVNMVRAANPLIDFHPASRHGIRNFVAGIFENPEQMWRMAGTSMMSSAQDNRVDPLLARLLETVLPLLFESADVKSFLQDFVKMENGAKIQTCISLLEDQGRKFAEEHIGTKMTNKWWPYVIHLSERFLKQLMASDYGTKVCEYVQNERYSDLSHFIKPDLMYLWGEYTKFIGNKRGQKQRTSNENESTGTTANEMPASVHLTIEELNLKLEKLLAEEKWHMVSELLEGGVTDAAQRLIVTQASEKADSRILTDYILPFCTAENRECVLPTLIEKNKWMAAIYVLGSVLREYMHSRFVEEMISRPFNADIDLHDLLSPYGCPNDDKREFTLVELFKQNFWNLFQEDFLQRTSRGGHILSLFSNAFGKNENEFLASLVSQFCPVNQKDSALQQLVKQGRWHSLDHRIFQGVSDTCRKWAIEMACKYAEENVLTDQILEHCANDQLDAVLTELEKRGLQKATGVLLQRFLSNVLAMLANDDPESKDREKILNVIKTRKQLICSVAKKGLPHAVQQLLESLKLDDTMCKLLPVSLVHLISQEHVEPVTNDSASSEENEQAFLELKQVDESIIMHAKHYTLFERKEPCNEYAMRQTIESWAKTIGQIDDAAALSPNSQLNHFNCFFKQYFRNRTRVGSDKAIVAMLATVPLIPTVQNVALRIMMHEDRWDVISIADLSHVWENVKRELFREAVRQKRWSLVKQWADYKLYDDQRGWALKEAYMEEQWNVFMLLADYGLSENELRRVHLRIAMYADRGVVCQLMERGGDATELRELLIATKTGRAKAKRKAVKEKLKKRRSWLAELEADVWSVSFEAAVRDRKWIAVLYQLRNRPKEEHIRKAIESAQEQVNQQGKMVEKLLRLSNINQEHLEGLNNLSDVVQKQTKEDITLAVNVALEDEAWHVVMQLAKLGMDDAQRNPLFEEMIRRQQWGVCRVLLEQGVSTRLQLAALPELKRMHQWVLISRLMEYDHGDSVIREVMKYALERREGSLVWHCMRLLQGQLSLKERSDLFEQGLTLEIWQAVKPLTEEKDSMGINHRDTALLDAIEHSQWDVLDHCLQHYGDIDSKGASGETGLQSAARKVDWQSVEELIWRGADQFLPDDEGYTVLHRAVHVHQWEMTLLLIKFHGDLNKSDRYNRTPMQKIIDYRKSELIDEALFWGQNINRSVNRLLETPLHAVCEMGDFKTMYYLVARGLDPLAINVRRQSVIMYAVMNKEIPQKMVAECIKLGVSTHQPKITDKEALVTTDPWYSIRDKRNKSGIISPFEYSILYNLPLVTGMLYESGSCSNKELFRINSELTTKVFKIPNESHTELNGAKHAEEKTVEVSADLVRYVQEVASTPRSLTSICRLVISHHLKVSHRRNRLVQKLPLSRFMKDYVMFSDLTDPNYGSNIKYRQWIIDEFAGQI